MCLRRKDSIVTPAISFSVDATGYVETSNIFVISKLILTPLTSFIVVSFFRKCIDAKRPYVKYNITPLVKKEKKGESMPSRHVFSITIIACAGYIYTAHWNCPAYINNYSCCCKRYCWRSFYKRRYCRNSSWHIMWFYRLMDIIIPAANT